MKNLASANDTALLAMYLPRQHCLDCHVALRLAMSVSWMLRGESVMLRFSDFCPPAPETIFN
jgi:hypothetical protein